MKILHDNTVTLIISDVHLGSPLSRAADLLVLLENTSMDRLVINGDLLDDFNFKNLQHAHWDVLTKLGELARKIEVVWVLGNHDMQRGVEVLGNMLGVRVVTSFEWFQRWNNRVRKLLAIHGHQFDRFMEENRKVSSVADFIYRQMQGNIGVTRSVLHYLKRTSKRWIRNVHCVRSGALSMADHLKADLVFCGHTHQPEIELSECGDITYTNSGDWVHEATYIRIDENGPVLCTWDSITTAAQAA